MSRRLDDRIRELCATVVAAEETDLEPLIQELKAALREHTGRLRKLAAAKIIAAKKMPPERRSYIDRRSYPTSQN